MTVPIPVCQRPAFTTEATSVRRATLIADRSHSQHRGNTANSEATIHPNDCSEPHPYKGADKAHCNRYWSELLTAAPANCTENQTERAQDDWQEQNRSDPRSKRCPTETLPRRGRGLRRYRRWG
jgi:hypothetical protein